MSEQVRPTCNISRTYKNSSVITKEESEGLPGIDVRQFPQGVPIATITVGTRITKNLQNYESVQMYVEISLPTVIEEAQECFAVAQAFVEKKLSEQVAIVDAHIAAKNRK